jgi:hypothetical protein
VQGPLSGITCPLEQAARSVALQCRGDLGEHSPGCVMVVAAKQPCAVQETDYQWCGERSWLVERVPVCHLSLYCQQWCLEQDGRLAHAQAGCIICPVRGAAG